MMKWEYVYAEAYKDTIVRVNGRPTVEVTWLSETKGPNISGFLAKAGREGWEVASICPASEGAGAWRIILKRLLA
jgi:hypothetical protein